MNGSGKPGRSTAGIASWWGWRHPWRWFRGTRRDSPLGLRGERVAERHLRRLGYTILARQWRDPQGEIDLIAVDQQTVVFVEVKTRHGHQGGHPLEAISAEKQRRLCRAALTFLRRHGLLEQRARFDAIAVTWPQDTRRPTVEHVRGAFEPAERWQMFA